MTQFPYILLGHMRVLLVLVLLLGSVDPKLGGNVLDAAEALAHDFDSFLDHRVQLEVG